MALSLATPMDDKELVLMHSTIVCEHSAMARVSNRKTWTVEPGTRIALDTASGFETTYAGAPYVAQLKDGS